MALDKNKNSGLNCNFCGKSRGSKEANRWPGVYICDECIELILRLFKTTFPNQKSNLESVPKP